MGSELQSGPGLGDLEKELTCSICTELLYQPLTLLDCLHIFCGSCLKEWFKAQASRRRSSPRFTCPSCRAIVRETRPNAKITTLLDMVLAANPDRSKPLEEREEIAQHYKHGDSVFPVDASEQAPSASDNEDRRLLQEVQELSLRENRSRRSSPSAPSSRSRVPESVGRDGQREDRSRRRREERLAGRQTGRSANRPDISSNNARRIEHQSSIRSLLSLSDTETMEEEILRQIFEEGLLEDIDLENLGPSQEEELSERIADAYRRRHRLRSRSQQRQEDSEPPRATTRLRAQSQSERRPTVTSPRESPRNPPVSRPHLLEPLVSRSGSSGHQRRLSDQGHGRRRTSPVPVNPASSSDVALRPAARSSSDMVADRPHGSHSARPSLTDATAPRPRRATASEQGAPNPWAGGSSDRDLRHTRNRPSIDSPHAVATPTESPQTASFPTRVEQIMANASTTSSLAPEVGGPVRQEPRPRPSSSRSNALRSASYTEPSISCDRCGKQNIQYDLHKKCTRCNDGNFHLCLRCYRLGRGCLNWMGFGASASADFEGIRASANGQPTPPCASQHMLLSFKYRPPSASAQRTTRDGKEVTNDDPARRMQTGLFCDICRSPSNGCFWKCGQCNEGDWGFCNKCVNQGRCCTHALLPVCRMSSAGNHSDPSTPSAVPSATSDALGSPVAVAPGTEAYKILSFSTNCDMCSNPIPASTLRFHCLRCNSGDYDICANCYLKFVASGKIHKENGHNGWRRCFRGHRMVVIGFEDFEEGQRRVIVRDLVGGRALKDEHVHQHRSSQSSSSPTHHSFLTIPTGPNSVPSPELGKGDWSWKEGSERRKKASRARNPTDLLHRSNYPPNGNNDNYNSASEPGTPVTPTAQGNSSISNSNKSPSSSRRFPPDGGVGLVVLATWPWYPEDGVKDELMFPRGAEITEAENINDDWFWGCYAGITGLFPGSHVSVMGEVA
ncbi:hypothetical protein P168DRAFT_292646 [Aspergillus campestris IBT 28561]|uniref:RING-type domain-containing protein n=1 Tax=Aspergillus campestris (strain IBT 28561) TaxID=1392248 RepID=A0A2I1CVB0_ASPC2|nr:uncharacterized protein P168DRAFT_292646 [Aspergillus campestris IBT 28561]PKY01544.1 hypothetical protein P168DRAFT_292646 [Aspergillus campestris IBT 28561]